MIIPVKHLNEAKTSLGNSLSASQRRELVLRMLEDVLRAVKMVESAKAVVVSPDSDVLDFARSKDTHPISEPDIGLNMALERAIEQAKKAGIPEVLIIPADLPLLRPYDVEAILEKASGDRDVVITPSKDGGTNALLVRPPDIINPQFGGKSFSKHVEQARHRKITPHIHRSKNVELDIDNPRDLVKLETRGLGTKAQEFLMTLE